MSTLRSGPVRSITLVKLTFSLAAVRPTTTASAPSLAPRGSLAAAVPSMAPSAFAPASPSIERSPRSSGSNAAAADSGAAQAARPSRDGARSAPVSSATLMARPGRRSNRFRRLAPPAMRPALMRVSATVSRAGGASAASPAPGAGPAISAAASPVAPIPAILTAPVVSSPLRSAPMCPRKPLLAPFPCRSS